MPSDADDSCWPSDRLRRRARWWDARAGRLIRKIQVLEPAHNLDAPDTNTGDRRAVVAGDEPTNNSIGVTARQVTAYGGVGVLCWFVRRESLRRPFSGRGGTRLYGADVLADADAIADRMCPLALSTQTGG